jgi:predicted amidohydrolase
VKIAVAQTSSTDDKQVNIDRALALVARAAESGPDLVVLPEAIMADFKPEGGVAELAEPLDGAFASALRSAAKEHGTPVVVGMFETSDEADRPYNTLLAIGPDGDLLGTYRKIHLYDAFGYRESDQLMSGPAEPLVVDIGGFKLGLMTCYDLRFPELSRALVDRGAEVLVAPAAWVRGPLKEQQWETLLAARAIENTCYVVAAAQNGRKYCGLSQVVDPQGVQIAAAGEDDGVAYADIDRGRLETIRKRNPSLLNRRYTVRPL